MVHGETLRNLTNARTNERDQQSGEPSKEMKMGQCFSLSVRGLNKRFGVASSGVWALRDVSFSLSKGTLTGVLGHNSAGKTTLLGSLCGSVKPTSGSIRLSGREVSRASELRRLCAYMPQPHVPLCGVTPVEALCCAAGMRGMSRRSAANLANDFLRCLDIEQYSHVAGENLSGGCRRLISLGMALVQQAPVILLDEPTNDVDPIRRSEVWKMLRQEADEGKTVLVVTHNLDEIGSVADGLLIFDHGHLVCNASPHQLTSIDELIRIEVNTTKPSLVLPELVVTPLLVEGGRLRYACSPEQAKMLLSRLSMLMDDEPGLSFSVQHGTLREAYERMIGTHD